MTCTPWGILSILALAAPAAGPGVDAIERAGLTRDPALDSAAERHAVEILANENAATLDRVRAAVVDAGLTDVLLLPFSAVGKGPALDHALAAMVGTTVTGGGFTHYGLTRRGAGREALVAVFVRRLVVLPTFPAKGTPPAMKVRGALGAKTHSLKAYLTSPRGPVTALVATVDGRAFEVQVPFARGPGRYDFELLAELDRGPEVAALWSFFIDVPPARPELDAVAELPNTVTTLEALVRRARAHANVRAISSDDKLAAAASTHAKAVCAAGLAAHVLPGGDTPTERARGAGYAGPITENVAIAGAVARAHDNLMASPSHRRNIVDPAARRYGQAVAKRGDGVGTTWCVVQMFGLE